jgi:hypothetical protein
LKFKDPAEAVAVAQKTDKKNTTISLKKSLCNFIPVTRIRQHDMLPVCMEKKFYMINICVVAVAAPSQQFKRRIQSTGILLGEV